MTGAIFMKLGRAPAMMSMDGILTSRLRGDFDGDAAHLKHLVERDGLLATRHGMEERRGARPLPLVLAPELGALESRPTEADQLPEVVQLQDTPLGEDLQTLLGKRLAAI